MSLTIQDSNAERLARYLAEATGESIPVAITRALEERVQKLHLVPPSSPVKQSDILSIAKRSGALPTLDPRDPDEILGYDEDGALR